MTHGKGGGRERHRKKSMASPEEKKRGRGVNWCGFAENPDGRWKKRDKSTFRTATRRYHALRRGSEGKKKEGSDVCLGKLCKGGGGQW